MVIDGASSVKVPGADEDPPPPPPYKPPPIMVSGYFRVSGWGAPVPPIPSEPAEPFAQISGGGALPPTPPEVSVPACP